MIFKLKHKKLGGHVHVQFFSGKNPHSLGLNGLLIFAEEEWPIFYDVVTAATREDILDSEFVQVIVQDVGE